jgi:hypothetical protein
MASLRYEFLVVKNARRARGGTLTVTGTATAGGARPVAPTGTEYIRFESDTPVYVDIGSAPNPTVSANATLVMPGEPIELSASAGDLISAVLASDITAPSGTGGGGDASASNQATQIAALGAPADSAWSGTGNSSIIAALKALWAKLVATAGGGIKVVLVDGTTGAELTSSSGPLDVTSTQFPAALGQQTAAGSVSVVLSSDGPFASNFGLKADAPATDSTSAWSSIALLKAILAKFAGTSSTAALTTAQAALSTSAAQVLAANSARVFAEVRSLDLSISIYLGKDNTVTAGNGHLLKAGEAFSFEGYTGAIWAIAASGTPSVSRIEW